MEKNQLVVNGDEKEEGAAEKAAVDVDGGAGMLDSVTSFVGRAATAVVPKSAAAAAPAASLAAIASRADSGDTAAALASAAMVGKVGVAALSATGVGLPIAGALGVVLLVAYTLTKMLNANAKLQGMLADVLSIISNCYTIDRLIDRTLGVCTIALFGDGAEVEKMKQETTFDDEMFKSRLVLAFQAKKQAYAANGAGSTLELIQLVAPNKDLKKRMFEKLGTLTAYLLLITPDPILAALHKEASSAGFGSVVQGEVDRRGKFISKRFGQISRAMNRTLNAADMQNEMIKELTVIEGLFMLVKAQFDTTVSYYADHMDDWPRVRDVVERTPEFRDYLVPKVLSEVVDKIDDKVLEAATLAVNKAVENANEAINTEEATTTTTTGGGRTRRRCHAYAATRRPQTTYVRRHRGY